MSDWSSDVCSSDLAAGAGVDIVYGGGRVGMMGAVAEGAQAAGGRVVGIIPQHLEALEAGNRTASEYLVVNSMHARKQLMRSEEHTSELQSLMRISYAVFCLKKTNHHNTTKHNT